MSLDGIITSIAVGIQLAVPVLEVCAPVGGNVDLTEVLRRSTQLPAVFVFCVGTDDAVVANDKVQTRATFAAVLVCKAGLEAPPVKMDRAAVAARLAGRVIFAITTGKTWGNDEIVTGPRSVDSRNRYSAAADKAGVALWAASWEHTIVLTKDPPAGELDDLLAIHAEYLLEDGTPPATPDAEDVINL